MIVSDFVKKKYGLGSGSFTRFIYLHASYTHKKDTCTKDCLRFASNFHNSYKVESIV